VKAGGGAVGETTAVAFLEGEGPAEALGGGGHSEAPSFASSEASLASGLRRTECEQVTEKQLLTCQILLTAGVSLGLDAFQEF
jgi:hypothetical protein